MLPSLGIDTWESLSINDLVNMISHSKIKPLVLIDGKSGSGKTTLAVKLAETLKANMVSTDDICWFTDPVHWDDEMIKGIILPWLDGKCVAYRPSGWVRKGRAGRIAVDSDKPLIIEGNGACRKTLREFATYSIWVDTEPDISRARVIERDLAKGENGGTLESVTEFTDWWDSVVDPFLLEEEAWKFVSVIVNGYRSDLKSSNLLVHCPG